MAEKSEIAKREEAIQASWEEQEVFEKSLSKDAPNGEFVFYDGPPFATGTPHYGHLLQSAIKDAIPRYKTMCGYRVARQWGWDCHGLPIENIVEKEIGSKSKKDILAMGVKKFNDLCREQIFTFIHEWERIIPRFGRWADMEHPYRTMDFEYMQSEWWAFKTLHEKGLVYEDYRSMHICPRCETTLSQGEVAEGYKDVKDLSATVKFELEGHPGTYFLAWTTTPWTLPGNVALAVGKDIEYVQVKTSEGNFILAKDRLADVLGERAYEIVDTRKGSECAGATYVPLFDSYAKDERLKNRENGWKVYAADFVTTDTGTGIVHIAPAFGADDMALGKKENLPFVQHVKMDGTFVSETGEFAGLDLKPRAKDKPEEIREADLTIVKHLEKEGKMFAHEKYQHSYPHCWRCDTALLNYATSSWFVAVEKMKPTLLETAKDINWFPPHIKEGRWGNWLEGARDWSISRQRFWANTIPVWRCQGKVISHESSVMSGGCGRDVVFGSAAELEAASGVAVKDLHKEVVDEVAVACECGGTMRRVPDVLDTWFDSGSVPFATKSYGAAQAAAEEKLKSADFIGEAQDQTRAWFYYQHVLAGALFGTEAFENCVVTGIVLAEDGKKMSKKLKNYPDPVEMIDKYGADAMRMYMLSSPVVRAESLAFSEKEVAELSRKIFGRLANVYEFYALYASPRPSSLAPHPSSHVLDRWILTRLAEVQVQVTAGLEAYALDEATRPFDKFVDDLSTWYLRRSRDRIKAAADTASSASLRGPADSSAVPPSTSPESASPRLASEAVSAAAKADAEAALSTLAHVLRETAKLLAPFAPFFADWLWMQMGQQYGKEESVHLAQWTEPRVITGADLDMLGNMHEVRNIVSLALEQRAKAKIPVRQPLSRLAMVSGGPAFSEELLQLIRDEVNVKSTARIAGLPEGFAVELDTAITPELREEGLVREAHRVIQGARKTAGLAPTDTAKKAVLTVAAEEVQALRSHAGALAAETRVAVLDIVAADMPGMGMQVALDA